MTQILTQLVARVVAATTGWSVRHNIVVIVVAIVSSVGAAWYSATHIGINTNTADMLSERLPWRQAYMEFAHAFPYFSDSIVIVVDGATTDLAEQAASTLSQSLAADGTHFSEVFHPTDSAFFRRQQLLYATLPELEQLADQLSGAQALLGRLAGDPGLLGLLQLLDDITLAEPGELPREALTLLDAVSNALQEFAAGNTVPLSWRSLLLGSENSASRRVVFTVSPRLDYSSILPAKDAIGAIRTRVESLGYSERDGVSVRLTGEAALAYDELTSVIRGAEQAGLLAFAMITVCLLLGLRSLSLVVATLVTLIVGLVFTATFAVVAVGTLNMISVAFAVLYVGLGVDFAIHLSLRYRELAAEFDKTAAIGATARHLGGSIALCAVTTAIGFFAFLPTAYRGVAELGLISGVGMFIGFAASFTVLPALFQSLPAPRMPAAKPAREVPAGRDPHHTRVVLALTVACAAAAVFALPHARFDLNPLHLNDPNAESVTTIEDLAGAGDQPLYDISMVVADGDAAARTARELGRLDTVAEVLSARDLVPSAQDEKLAVIDDLRWSLGGELEVGTPTPLSPADVRARLAALEAALEQRAATPAAAPAYAALRAALAALDRRLATLPAAEAQVLLGQVEDKLMRHFVPQIERLQAALEADSVTLETLPEALRQRWIAADGRYRLEISPARNLDDNRELVRYVDSVRSIAGARATGTPVINIEASRAVTTAFNQAFTTAVVLITVLLWIVLRRAREVVVVLAPLALASLLTTALTVALGVPFNFANIIALPLLMGIGVDSTLHMLHRYRTTFHDGRSLLRTSTARAVLFSALTTTASFGNLAVSPHAGTASMGVMLTVGLGMTLLCTLVVLPMLMRRFIAVDPIL